MSGSADSLPKPKVRFDPENPQSGPFQGPRIREIITLDRPVRIVPALETSPAGSVVPKSREDNKNRRIHDNEEQKTKSLPGSSRTKRREGPTLEALEKELERLTIEDKKRREKSLERINGRRNGNLTKTGNLEKTGPKKQILEKILKKSEGFEKTDDVGEKNRGKKLDLQKIEEKGGKIGKVAGKSKDSQEIGGAKGKCQETGGKSVDSGKMTPKSVDFGKSAQKPTNLGKSVQKSSKTPSKLILKPQNVQTTSRTIPSSSKPLQKSSNKENLPKKPTKTPDIKLKPKVTNFPSQKQEKNENISSNVIKTGKNNQRTVPKRNLGLMPCMKLKKAEEPKKIKVDVLRNVSAPIPSVFIGPGITRERSPRNLCDFEDDKVQKRNNFGSGDKLDRPEYNSIVSTIKMLSEARRKKIVEDVGTLPSIYKDLVNGKVSSALDFPASQSVYHDLIDISIDEKQLPMRITRSKDPEPRPKDAVPILSDFFVPQFADEYSVAVNNRPRTPVIIDPWNGFRISDKIKGWKASLHD